MLGGSDGESGAEEPFDCDEVICDTSSDEEPCDTDHSEDQWYMYNNR